MNTTKQEIWWNNLSEVEQDCINHSLFNKKILDIEVAYKLLGNTIR